MLKKVILGILGFILVAIAGIAIYIYTLDWNKHKTIVLERLTQITGLKSQINGNLKVDFFPMPKITAGQVSFFPKSGNGKPLVEINEITANLELKPLLSNNFIVKSMILTNPTIYVSISENGQLNWKNVGNNSNNKSGNVEVSFNDIRLNGATLSYKNEQNQEEFSIPNISASVSAPNLAGPYRTNGKFIHNNSEFKFSGDILKNPNIKMKISFDNAATASKLDIDGEIGSVAKGNIIFDTRNIADIANIVFGENTIDKSYQAPLYTSFQYDYNNGSAKLDNFNIKYGTNNIGNGNMLLKLSEKDRNFAADFNMTQFDLSFVEKLAQDYIHHVNSQPKANDIDLTQYSAMLHLKCGHALYRESAVQNLVMELALQNGILDITRFSALFPGETSLKTVGKINLTDKLEFVFNQSVDSKDLRIFASLFGIDLSKLAAEENKKSIFKNAKAELKMSGDLETLTVSIPKAVIDSTDMNGNVGFVSNAEKLYVLADISASKILFDKYIRPQPSNLAKASYKEKFIAQMNLIPWNRNINVEADVLINSAVYNQIPMEKINLQFVSDQDKLDVKKFTVENIAGAQISTNFAAEKVFTDPVFNNATYLIKTSNFPYFATTMGINFGEKDLFKRKLFAAQGAFSGTFEVFNLSSVQKFGETEFSYTGTVASPAGMPTAINGDLELKTNNFLNLIKSLNFDYTPNIVATPLTLAGKIKGSRDIFEYSDINAYLGANHINGYIQLDNSGTKPILKSELAFNKFDADRWFNLSKKTKQHTVNANAFIDLPAFDNEAIDYSFLDKADFDIKATTESLIYDNKPYSNAKINAKLKNGVLNVASFETKSSAKEIAMSFILNTKENPSINGNYKVSGIKTPGLGGRTYFLDSGTLRAEGTFNSSAYSEKSFFENLNSDGVFQLTNTAMKGWDLDIIKFDLEQRKLTTGFEDAVRKNLENGKSAFTKIDGHYKINQGVVTADKIIWDSPVVNMNMQLNLNFSDRLFTAVFGVVFHNATFSDVVNFTMKGDLANPVLEVDLSDSVKRIKESENQIGSAKEIEQQKQRDKLSDRIKDAQTEAENILKEIKDILQSVETFQPQTNDKNIMAIYNENVFSLQDMESKTERVLQDLAKLTDEKDLIEIEAQLNLEKSKLKLMPKILEDNFIADCKNVYEETLNKIIWLYDVAVNNSSYYNELTDVYIQKMENMKNNGIPLSSETEEKLIKSINAVSKGMDNIDKLHAKIREDYLFILDVVNVSEMNDNNQAAEATLQTMASYVAQLNKKIISSLKVFRKSLELKPRDDTEYLVFPPQNVKDIDTTKPTVKKTTSQNKKLDNIEEIPQAPQDDGDRAEKTLEEEKTSPKASDDTVEDNLNTEQDKKKVEALTSFQEIRNGLGQFVKQFNSSKEKRENLEVILSSGFSGLSQILSTANSQPFEENISVQASSTATDSPAVDVADEAPIESTTIAIVDENKPVPALEAEVIDSKVLQAANATDETSLDAALVIDSDILQESAKKSASISNLVDKTQVALNDILTSIKEAEQAIQEEVSLHTKEEPHPLQTLDIAKYTIPANQIEKNSLKRNPVIAMNIGKELTPTQNFDFGHINAKSRFNTKQKQFNTVLNALPTVEEPILPLSTTSSFNSSDDNKVIIEEKNLPSLNEQPEANRKYLHIASAAATKTTGYAGKSILGEPIIQSESSPVTKYLFAANDMQFSELRGKVGKNISVK